MQWLNRGFLTQTFLLVRMNVQSASCPPPPRGEMLLPGMLAVCGQEHVASSEGITHVPVGTQVTNIRGKKIQVRNYRLAAPASL